MAEKGLVQAATGDSWQVLAVKGNQQASGHSTIPSFVDVIHIQLVVDIMWHSFT